MDAHLSEAVLASDRATTAAAIKTRMEPEMRDGNRMEELNLR
jgi:hypothetical protein